ncbi:hypothetical protein DSCW_32970 [Desulfosarcina widdelii]|uniref:Uncharacterized protein n=1 Tax=Desulfosarcina widdelii TaxID=947919 RepID=A0A5K7Z596_9BACT|nr:hypothetical protein [Desulfosarcina widdelii]BBO75880.1 hypothetical protein DSCW_32970 [Desulfosarcina widdelii]
MERRKITDRRHKHIFVSEDRRSGPFDRRDKGHRRQEIEEEREKIERIRAFKAKDRAASSTSPPLFTKKRVVWMGLAILVLVVVLYLFR